MTCSNVPSSLVQRALRTGTEAGYFTGAWLFGTRVDHVCISFQYFGISVQPQDIKLGVMYEAHMQLTRQIVQLLLQFAI